MSIRIVLCLILMSLVLSVTDGLARLIYQGTEIHSGIGPLRRTYPPDDRIDMIRCRSLPMRKRERCNIYSICVLNKSIGEPTCGCPAHCMAVFDPVCGTNRHTYANYCSLAYDSCSESRNITVAFIGQCPGHRLKPPPAPTTSE